MSAPWTGGTEDDSQRERLGTENDLFAAGFGGGRDSPRGGNQGSERTPFLPSNTAAMSVPSGFARISYGEGRGSLQHDNSSSNENAWKLWVFRIVQAVFGIFAALLFIFGITNTAHEFVGAEGYNEVCTVLGSLFVFPFVFNLYQFLKSFLPNLQGHKETRAWMIGLRVLLVCAYIAQQGLMMVYMVNYVDKLAMLFLIPDIVITGMMLMPSTKLTAFWANAYVLVFAAKLGLFWPNLDQSNAETNPFADRDNALGPNGLLAICFLTIPIIQFPVLVSRLKHGMKIFDAYTVNMAAVFAHTLHLMDALELYLLGLERLTFAADVQYLLIMFSVMGFVTCNLYYVTLFFTDDTVTKLSKQFQPSSLNVLGSEDTTGDEDLLHYFVWELFFIDLPYATMRSIAWMVHGTTISVFLAKNLMMMAAVAMLLISHSRRTQQNTMATAKGTAQSSASSRRRL